MAGGVTHLVAATARNQKYEVAVGKEIPCTLPRWVEEVWKVSNNEMVTAVDPRFSSHRCPALLGVTVSVSQLNRADLELLKKSVERGVQWRVGDGQDRGVDLHQPSWGQVQPR